MPSEPRRVTGNARLLGAGGLALLAAVAAAPQARASGFAIMAQGTRALGAAFSGQATLQDASTVWFNPAGMGGITAAQVAGVANVIDTAFDFRNTASTGAYALPGAVDADGGATHLVPQAFGVLPLGEDLRLGLSLNTPFGLSTDYPQGWRGQYVALLSEATSYNVNPALAWRVSEHLWVAGGVSWQRFSAELQNFAGPAGVAVLKAHDSGWGYNLGAQLSLPSGMRAGFAWRSKISYSLEGRARFSANSALDSDATAPLDVPESATLGVAVPVGSSWELSATASWTRWSRVRTLQVTRTSASLLGPAGSTISELPFDWSDAWLLAAGATWKAGNGWTWRAGIAHDPRVSKAESRTPRLPDQSRVLVTAGGTYEFSARNSLDFALGHEFIRDASVANAAPGVPGQLVGSFDNRADVLSLQFNHRF